jgi:hypothetical protein
MSCKKAVCILHSLELVQNHLMSQESKTAGLAEPKLMKEQGITNKFFRYFSEKNWGLYIVLGLLVIGLMAVRRASPAAVFLRSGVGAGYALLFTAIWLFSLYILLQTDQLHDCQPTCLPSTGDVHYTAILHFAAYQNHHLCTVLYGRPLLARNTVFL